MNLLVVLIGQIKVKILRVPVTQGKEAEDRESFFRQVHFVVTEHVDKIFWAAPRQIDVLQTTVRAIHAVRAPVLLIVLVTVQVSELGEGSILWACTTNHPRAAGDGPVVVVFRLDGCLDIQAIDDTSKRVTLNSRK